VHGVGPGSVLGGRYTTTVRIAQGALHERWRASDHTLEREVVLVCFPARSHVAALALDAARQAAGVEDHRLVRVFDVGTDAHVSFIIEEPLTGSVPMSHLLRAGGLPPGEVRRIVGESAQALEKARHRGLHHLVLTPDMILRMPDGEVKVRGLATEAALTDAVRASEERASRLDAIGLVRVAYAGLTARWPGGGPDAPRAVQGLAPAPTVVGGVAAPSEIAVGVPADLDLICRLTLNDDTGPLSPGDLAVQIAPWPSAPPVSDGASGIGLTPPRTGPDATQVLPTVPASAAHLYGRLSGAGLPSGAPTLEQPAVTPPPASERPAAGLVAAGAAAAGAAGAIGGKVGSFARAAAERSRARGVERRAAHDHFEGQDIHLSEALDEAPREELEPPVPLLGHTEAPTGEQSRVALAIVGALTLVALVIAIPNLAKIGRSDAPRVRPTVTVTASGPSPSGEEPSTSATTTEGPSTSGTTAPGGPLLVVGGTGFDPQDDNTESDNRAKLAYDGDTGTAWESRWYGSATYNRSKDGVGIVLDLSTSATVREVDLTLPVAQDVTVYAANDASLEGAQKIGSVSGESGTITLKAPDGLQPATKIIVWVTKPAPAEAPNHFRAQISEVVVR
jgi:hypothetical protein